MCRGGDGMTADIVICLIYTHIIYKLISIIYFSPRMLDPYAVRVIQSTAWAYAEGGWWCTTDIPVDTRRN